MGLRRCPGSSAFSQPKPEVLQCPDCRVDVEIWSDEATGQCPKCGKTVIRTVSQSCVDWCRYAKECLGDEKFRKYGAMKAAMRKPALLKAVAEKLAADPLRLAHANKVVSYAETILPEEPQADPNVVIAAAALHNLGRLDHATAPDAPPDENALNDARAILRSLDYPDGFIKAVCQVILDHHCGRDENKADIRVLHDADLLAGAERRKARSGDAGALPEEFLTAFLTPAGRRIATDLRQFMATE